MIFTPHYDIRDFKWVKRENTFYGDAFDLYEAETEHPKTFPKDGSQFVIKNYKTGNFRRFRFWYSTTDSTGMHYAYFTSEEDEHKCIINLDKP